MPIPPDPVDTIERFAELSAILDDPHALRVALLSGVGLDERAWRAIEERWMRRIREPGGAALAERLGNVYAETRKNLSESVVPPTEPAGPPSPPSSIWRSGAHPLAGTMDVGAHSLRPALPFQPAPEGGVVLAPTPPRRAVNPLAQTLESPQGLPVGPALPFRPF
jgi:hypothetical protein